MLFLNAFKIIKEQINNIKNQITSNTEEIQQEQQQNLNKDEEPEFIGVPKSKYITFLSHAPNKQIIMIEDYFQISKVLQTEFIDSDFPPNLNSLGQVKKLEKYEWRSLSEQYGQNFQLFPSQLQQAKYDTLPCQGKLGNCYFVSALTTLYYNHPQTIENLFLEHRKDISCVKINFDGQWTVVWVDHYFPFNKKTNQPAFCKYLKGAVWVMIIEKAWAKLHGNYKVTSGGYSRTALRALTGAECVTVRTSQKTFKTQIEKFINKKYPITCGSKPKGKLEEIEANDEDGSESGSLVGKHVYSILKIIQVQDLNGNNQIYLKIRNPWGKMKWKGDQKDEIECEAMQDTIKKAKHKDQGVFYISLEKFQKYFVCAVVCYYVQKYQYESFRFYTNQKVFLSIQINESGTYRFQLSQRNRRVLRENDNIKLPNFFPTQMGLLDKSQVQIAENFSKNQKINTIKLRLEKGDYIIYTQVNFQQNFEHKEYILSSYGPDLVNFQQIQ